MGERHICKEKVIIYTTIRLFNEGKFYENAVEQIHKAVSWAWKMDVRRVRVLCEEEDRYYACACLGGYGGKIYMRVRRTGENFEVISVEPT